MSEIEDIGMEEFSELTPEEKQLNPAYLLQESLSLQARVHLSAHVTVDLRQAGPLYQYAISRRADAILALQDLIGLDPKDSLAISEAQTEVKQFFDVLDFITAKLQDGAHADQEIRERWPDGESEPDDDEG